MEVLANTPRFDPHRYVSAAVMAAAGGNLDQAITLIDEAYIAFDLCLAGCTQGRRGDEVEVGEN
jgi:hypothetical protein